MSDQIEQTEEEQNALLHLVTHAAEYERLKAAILTRVPPGERQQRLLAALREQYQIEE